MTQLIWCRTPCGDKELKKYPGEGNKKVAGLARCDMICDSCGTPIQELDPVFAVSFYINGGYMKWEDRLVDHEAYLKYMANGVFEKQNKIKEMLSISALDTKKS